MHVDQLPQLAMTPNLEPIDTPYLSQLERVESDFNTLPRVRQMKSWQRECVLSHLHQLLATAALLFTQLPSHEAQNELLWALASAAPVDADETLVIDFLRDTLCA